MFLFRWSNRMSPGTLRNPHLLLLFLVAPIGLRDYNQTLEFDDSSLAGRRRRMFSFY